jgi:hypothetical protein
MAISNFFENLQRYLGSQSALPVSMTPVANGKILIIFVWTLLVVELTTPVVPVAKFAAGGC